MKSKTTLSVVFIALMAILQHNLYGSSPNELTGRQEAKTISGIVSDVNTGDALPGVSILIKGTTNGTITDASGQFTINASPGDVLTFSFVGYLSEDVVVSDATQLTIRLVEDIIGLEELVVIGYGTQKKSDLTGAVSSVSVDDMQKLPNKGVSSMLQGMAAGVQVLQNSGQPGSQPVIRIRGLATVNGGSPLIVIDGISGGSLADLNPADVQSIEVLKDAASQSIYGSAGGNGVILVTTKKGKKGKMRVNLDQSTGIQYPWRTKTPAANSQEYAALYNQYQISLGAEPHFPGEKGNYLNPVDNTPLQDIDYVKEIFRPALVNNTNLSVSGGNDISTLFFGFNYNKEDGTVLGTSNDRFVLRLNSEHKIGKRITVGENFNLSQNSSVTQAERNEYNSPMATAIQMFPFVPIYADDGSGNFAYREANLSGNIQSPLSSIEYNNNISKNLSINGNVFATVKIVKGLTFTSRYGIGYNPNTYRRYTPPYTIGATESPSPSMSNSYYQYAYNQSMNNSWQWQNYFNYDVSLAESHNFSMTAGFESGYYKNDYTNRQTNYDTVYFAFDDWQDYADADTMDILQRKLTESTGYSYFFRLSYDYKGILLLQGNLRRDASSKFGPNNRYGLFKSVSAGFKFSEIGLIKDMGIFDLGKIRIGYGETGNSDIQPFQYLGTVSSLPMNGHSFDGFTIIPGAGLITASNLDLGWETVVTSNIGVDLSVMNNRLGFSFDLFKRRNQDMLLRKSVPSSVGYYVTNALNELGDANIDTRPLQNYGTLDNKGFEITAFYKQTVGDFKFEVNANITRAVTVIDDIGDPLTDYGDGRGVGNVCQTHNGGPVSAFYGYETDGVYTEDEFVWLQAANGRWRFIAEDPNGAVSFEGNDVNGNPITVTSTNPSARPGDFKYRDVDGDGAITNLDYVEIGNPNPDFTYGLGLYMEYKGLDVSMFFQGSYGNDIFNLLKTNSYNIVNGNLNVTSDLENGYIPAVYEPGTATSAPRLISPAENTETGIKRIDGPLSQSDFFVEDGSYLRLKSLQIGYTIGVADLQKIKMQKLRVYMSALNLLTFTNYTGFDPEVNETNILERGFDKGTYPQSQMFTLGINCIF